MTINSENNIFQSYFKFTSRVPSKPHNKSVEPESKNKNLKNSTERNLRKDGSLRGSNRLQTYETYEDEDYYLQPHSWGSFERKHKLKNNADHINSNNSNNKSTTTKHISTMHQCT